MNNRFKEALTRLPRMIAYALMAHGAIDFIGMPIVGRILAGFLDGVAFGASELSDYIKYQSVDDANAIIQYQLGQGATIDRFYHNEDGTVAVQYRMDAYEGNNIHMNTLKSRAGDWV